jgi:hypothetical protein
MMHEAEPGRYQTKGALRELLQGRRVADGRKTMDDLSELKRRLDRLERGLWRWKRATLVACLGLTAVLLMGQTRPTPVPKLVEAEKFLLRDANGMPRAMLATQPSGATALVLSDKSGTLRASLNVTPSGSPSLDLYDRKGKSRIVFGVQEDSRPLLVFYDENEKSRVDLEVRQDGTPALALSNQSGRPKVAMEVRKDGRARVALFDELPNGPARAGVLVEADGSASLILTNKDGKVIWKVP